MLSRTSFTRSFGTMDAGIASVAKDIYWIGVNDWDTREFHSMEAPVGTSYNSYLISNDEPTLIDAVKYTQTNCWINRLRTIVGEDLKGLKRIVLQHAEPDHTSALPSLIEKAPHIEVVCTKQNLETLSRFYNTKTWNVKLVKLGETFKVGDREMVLAGVPMAHWPEQAVAYIPSQKVLFSSDAFGQHLASAKRFYDEVDPCIFNTELKSYYANILSRHGRPVLNALKSVSQLPGVDVVLPSHGVGFRRPQDIQMATELYTKWAKGKTSPKLTILYDANWFGTERMAVSIASGASKVSGVEINMFHARKTHITRVATEVLDSQCLAIGSAVLHENILPDLAMHLQYLRCLNIRNRNAGIFGTYGWTIPTVSKEIRNQLLCPTKTGEVFEPIMAQWGPKNEELVLCEEMGRKLAEVALEKASSK